MNTIDSLLKGSIDMHAHYGPDPVVARKVDALMGAQFSARSRDARHRSQKPSVLHGAHGCLSSVRLSPISRSSASVC